MTIAKQLIFLCFFFFMLNIVGPTLALLHSKNEISTVVISLEKETETKNIEGIEEFSELDFDKTHSPLRVHSYTTQLSLSLVFYNKVPNETTPLENTSPPPELV